MNPTVKEQMLTYFKTTNLPITLMDSSGKKLTELGNIKKPFEDLGIFPSKDAFQSDNSFFNYVSAFNEHYLSLKFQVNNKLHIIVVGPFRYSTLTQEKIKNLIKKEKLQNNQLSYYYNYYNGLPQAVRGSAVQHYKLLELLFCKHDLIFNDVEKFLMPLEAVEKNVIEYREIDFYHHQYYQEQNILKDAFTNMDVSALSKFKQRNFPGLGLVSVNDARNHKNLQIVGIALFERYVIEHGVDPHTAFTIGDAYLRKLEDSKLQEDADIIMQDAFRKFYNAIQTSFKVNFSKPVRKAMMYINQNLSIGFNIKDVANYAQVSPGHLSSLFKKELTISFTDYVLYSKIDEAKKLLAYTNHSLADITGILNFSSKSYFVSCFKKVVGVTPAKYITKDD